MSLGTFLQESKVAVDTIHHCSAVHVVLGNPACDLDSVVSSFVYAFFLAKVSSDPTTVYIPILNIPKADFQLRTEVTHFLRNSNIDKESLTFRDEIDLNALRIDKRLKLTLVDHNALSGCDDCLDDCIVEILDHHQSSRHGKCQIGINISLELVGSCATLVSERILDGSEEILDKTITTLLIGTILLDTVNLSEKEGRVTPKDVKILEKLEARYPVVREDLFNDLQKAKFDISDLTTTDILRKDYKQTSSQGSAIIGISSITLDLETLLQREDFPSSVSGYTKKLNLDALLLMTISFPEGSQEGSRRQLAIYSNQTSILEKLTTFLQTVEDGELKLEEFPSHIKSLLTFELRNRKASRKKILPFVERFLMESNIGSDDGTTKKVMSTLPDENLSDLSGDMESLEERRENTLEDSEVDLLGLGVSESMSPPSHITSDNHLNTNNANTTDMLLLHGIGDFSASQMQTFSADSKSSDNFSNLLDSFSDNQALASGKHPSDNNPNLMNSHSEMQTLSGDKTAFDNFSNLMDFDPFAVSDLSQQSLLDLDGRTSGESEHTKNANPFSLPFPNQNLFDLGVDPLTNSVSNEQNKVDLSESMKNEIKSVDNFSGSLLDIGFESAMKSNSQADESANDISSQELNQLEEVGFVNQIPSSFEDETLGTLHEEEESEDVPRSSYPLTPKNSFMDAAEFFKGHAVDFDNQELSQKVQELHRSRSNTWGNEEIHFKIGETENASQGDDSEEVEDIPEGGLNVPLTPSNSFMDSEIFLSESNPELNSEELSEKVAELSQSRHQNASPDLENNNKEHDVHKETTFHLGDGEFDSDFLSEKIDQVAQENLVLDVFTKGEFGDRKLNAISEENSMFDLNAVQDVGYPQTPQNSYMEADEFLNDSNKELDRELLSQAVDEIAENSKTDPSKASANSSCPQTPQNSYLETNTYLDKSNKELNSEELSQKVKELVQEQYTGHESDVIDPSETIETSEFIHNEGATSDKNSYPYTPQNSFVDPVKFPAEGEKDLNMSELSEKVEELHQSRSGSVTSFNEDNFIHEQEEAQVVLLSGSPKVGFEVKSESIKPCDSVETSDNASNTIVDRTSTDTGGKDETIPAEMSDSELCVDVSYSAFPVKEFYALSPHEEDKDVDTNGDMSGQVDSSSEVQENSANLETASGDGDSSTVSEGDAHVNQTPMSVQEDQSGGGKNKVSSVLDSKGTENEQSETCNEEDTLIKETVQQDEASPVTEERNFDSNEPSSCSSAGTNLESKPSELAIKPLSSIINEEMPSPSQSDFSESGIDLSPGRSVDSGAHRPTSLNITPTSQRSKRDRGVVAPLPHMDTPVSVSPSLSPETPFSLDGYLLSPDESETPTPVSAQADLLSIDSLCDPLVRRHLSVDSDLARNIEKGWSDNQSVIDAVISQQEKLKEVDELQTETPVNPGQPYEGLANPGNDTKVPDLPAQERGEAEGAEKDDDQGSIKITITRKTPKDEGNVIPPEVFIDDMEERRERGDTIFSDVSAGDLNFVDVDDDEDDEGGDILSDEIGARGSDMSPSKKRLSAHINLDDSSPTGESPAILTPCSTDEMSWEDDSMPKRSSKVSPIPEYTAREEYSDRWRWRRVMVGDQEYTVDMKCIEPFKKVLSHGGYYGDGVNAIIVFASCYMPDKSRKDYDYVMNNLFLFVVSSLELLVAQDYVIVYFHGAAPRSKIPSLGLMKKCYQMIDRRLKKNLKGLYIVHPTTWLRTVVRFTRPFVSSKFFRKLKFINTLQELQNYVSTEYMFIPDEVKRYDDERIQKGGSHARGWIDSLQRENDAISTVSGSGSQPSSKYTFAVRRKRRDLYPEADQSYISSSDLDDESDFGADTIKYDSKPISRRNSFTGSLGFFEDDFLAYTESHMPRSIEEYLAQQRALYEATEANLEEDYFGDEET